MSKRQYLFLLILMLSTSILKAQTDLPEGDTLPYLKQLLDEVTVRASRVGEKTPLTHSDIDAAEIRKNNKGADLPYLLQNTPSLVVTSDAGTGIGYTSLHIRGNDLTRINVTLNGVPINGAEDYQVYFVDLPDLASSVDNIQVQRGVGTSTNGSVAFGASINIKTDEMSATPFATLSSAGGSFNSLKNTLNFGTGRSQNGFNLSGRLSRIRSDGYIDRSWAKLKSYYLSGSWSNQNNMLKFIMMSGTENTYQAWNGIPKSIIDSNPTYNPAGEMYDKDGNFLGFYDNETDNYTQSYYQLHYAHNFSEKLTLSSALFLTTGKGYYENYMNGKNVSDYRLHPVWIDDEFIDNCNFVQQKWLDNYFYGANFSLNHQSKRFKTTFGGGWNHFEGAHFGKPVWAEIPIPTDYEWYRNQGHKTDWNLFAKTNADISTHLSLFADLQFRHVLYEINGEHEDLRDITQSHNYNFINPKGGVFYSLNEKNDFYFSVACSHREPSRNVFEDTDESQLDKVKAEQLIDYELGYNLKTQKFSFSTNLYYMDYKDQLVLTGEINSVGEAVMTNVDNSYRLGLEATVNYQICNQFAINGNLALSRNKILGFTDYLEDWENGGYQTTYLGTTDISFSPELIGGFNLIYKPINDLSFNLQGQYVSRQYIDNTSNLERSLDPYFVSNLHINYDWQQNIFKTLNFSFSVNNIFNRRYCSNAWVYRAYMGHDLGEYLEDGYFPQAGINFMLGVTVGI